MNTIRSNAQASQAIRRFYLSCTVAANRQVFVRQIIGVLLVCIIFCAFIGAHAQLRVKPQQCAETRTVRCVTTFGNHSPSICETKIMIPSASITHTEDTESRPNARNDMNIRCAPNPSGLHGNSSTTIFYTIPEDGFVHLRILNLHGQVVSDLVHERKNAGLYSVLFGVGNLPGGLYMCRLDTGRRIIFEKLLLVK